MLYMRASVVDEQIQASVARIKEPRQSPDTAAVLHVQQVEDDPETLGSQEIGGRAAQRGTPRR
jgi:hypothetical protein